ncbi:MAG: MASE1 domain-containing protein [Opitutae bacterium]|nr:MASE1 domain-containing protein [Opitutae bacterium]
MRVPSSIDYLAKSLLLLVAWTLMGSAGMLCYDRFGATPVWPASGLGLAALVLWGPRYWPAVALGSVLISIAARVPATVYLPLSVANAIEATGAAWVLRRLNFRPSLSHPRDVVLLAAVSVPFCVLSAGIGVAVLGTVGAIPWHAWMQKSAVWVFGNFLGVLLVAPPLLVWSGTDRLRLPPRRLAEALLLATGLALVSVQLFFQPPEAAASRVPLAFLTFPFVVLAGMRFGLRGGTLATLLVAGLAVTSTAQRLGVFVAQDLRDSTALLMMFEGMLALTALFVGAATTDQRRRTNELRQHEQLFQGLAEANQQLLASVAWTDAAPQVLATLGQAARVDRASLYHIHDDGAGRVATSAFRQWCAPGSAPPDGLPALKDFDFAAQGAERWGRALVQGQVMVGIKSELPAAEAAILAHLGIVSVAVAPVLIDHHCWGFIGFADTHHPRLWSAQEVAILRSVATNIGIAIRRDQLRDELATSIARHQALLRAMPDSYYLHDRQGVFLDYHANDRSRLWMEPEGFLGRALPEVFPPDVAALIRSGFDQVAATGQPVLLQYTLALPTGPRHFERRIVRAEGDKFLCIVRDVTEQRQADLERERIERKLRETQKLESLGVLAGGIAHDFNNLLTAILGNASLAKLVLPAGSEAAPMLGQIESASHRAADLCRQMLAYAGRGQFVIDQADLNQLARDTVPLLQLSISKRARLQLDLAAQPLPVLADITQVRQVLMNLIINSAEAMGEGGGIITLRSGPMSADAAYLAAAHSSTDARPGSYYFLEVVDTGQGMSPETLAHIFDPFFTTKFTGRGLGLAAVLGIVQGHHGALHVTSQPGAGSAFRILFPPARATVNHTPASSGGTTPPMSGGRSGTVLVVDDEAHVRQTAASLLQRLGYQTVEAGDGPQAVAAFTAAPDTFKFVLLDLTMPGMDGSQTLTELQRVKPTAAVIVMSGYSEQESSRRLQGRGVLGFLPKPFSHTSLLSRLDLAGV